MTHSIRESTVDDMLAQAGQLFADHWQEVARNKRVMVLNPNPEPYRVMEREGNLLVLAAYDDDDIIGYSVTFIAPHLHYADLIVATNDVLFVAESHRKSRIGLALIHETEAKAKARGARLMTWHAKQFTALESLLPRLGYEVQEINFSREL